METVPLKPDIDNSTGFCCYDKTVPQRITRSRKISVDHHTNKKLFDLNGNRAVFQRMSSLTEDVLNDTSDVISGMEEKTTVHDWEETLIQQIQSLIENVKVSESLSECINAEINHNEPKKQPPINRARRKSYSSDKNGRFNASYKSAVTIGRRSSVTIRESPFSSNNSSRRTSSAGIEHGFCNYNKRRSSVAHAPTHLQSNNSDSATLVSRPRRRVSYVATDNKKTMSRRNSASQMTGSYTPGRRNSCANDPLISNYPRQRRKSSAKPVCFTVTKISSVQKRLHNIYRRRRRKERAHVDVTEIRNAMSVNNNNNSESGGDDDADAQSDASVSEVDSGPNNDKELNDINADSVGEQDNESSGEQKSEDQKHEARRKTSIQIRSWELSRRLRQRRREKRKGHNESDLI